MNLNKWIEILTWCTLLMFWILEPSDVLNSRTYCTVYNRELWRPAMKQMWSFLFCSDCLSKQSFQCCLLAKNTVYVKTQLPQCLLCNSTPIISLYTHKHTHIHVRTHTHTVKGHSLDEKLNEGSSSLDKNIDMATQQSLKTFYSTQITQRLERERCQEIEIIGRWRQSSWFRKTVNFTYCFDGYKNHQVAGRLQLAY